MIIRIALLSCCAAWMTVPAAAQDVTALTGVTVVNAGAVPLTNVVVIIDGARIVRVGPAAATAIPPNAKIIDASGKFVMPGLADMHNHVRTGSFRMQQNPRISLSVLLAFGVTTVFNPSVSVAEFTDLKTATLPDGAAFPRVFGTGPIITIKGDFLGAGVGAPTPETPDEARATVKTLKAAGVDAIKVNRDDDGWAMKQSVPVMKADVLAAVVDEAHRQGLKVFAHAPQLEHAKDVLKAGADGLLHGIIDRAVDQEFVDLMLRNRAVYVPTLSLYEDVADVAAWARRQSVHDDRQLLAALTDAFTSPAGVRQFESLLNNTAAVRSRLTVQRANLTRLSDAGVPIVMGTDAGFFGVILGVSSQLELALMVEAGLTPDAALRAATINAARMIGRDADYGSVDAGKMADLLVLDANPLEDIRNVRRIYRVIRGGVVHEPAQLLSGIRFTAAPGPAR